jgi:hypothetical protein
MTCARCKRERPVKARGLCNPCYCAVRSLGELAKWPRRGTLESLVCVCADPSQERIPWFTDAWQCANCKRPFLSDMVPDEQLHLWEQT